MTFINWSDPEELLGLLNEYVADERNDSHGDSGRHAFLTSLLHELTKLERQFAEPSIDASIEQLRALFQATDEEFSSDPVMAHVEACIEELEGIRDRGAA